MSGYILTYSRLSRENTFLLSVLNRGEGDLNFCVHGILLQGREERQGGIDGGIASISQS